jgi:hypothetical protein
MMPLLIPDYMVQLMLLRQQLREFCVEAQTSRPAQLLDLHLG